MGLDPASIMREYSVLFCLVCSRVCVSKFGRPGIVAVEAFERRSGGDVTTPIHWDSLK
jgi:hypothetical protein